MKECPYCGGPEYYIKMYMKGSGICFYRFDGSTEGLDNSEMHNGLNYKEFKTMYCMDCDKKIGMKKESV